MIEPKREKSSSRGESNKPSSLVGRLLAFIDPSRSEDPARVRKTLSARLVSIDGAYRSGREVERGSRRF